LIRLNLAFSGEGVGVGGGGGGVADLEGVVGGVGFFGGLPLFFGRILSEDPRKVLSLASF